MRRILFLAALLSLLASPAWAQDPVKVAPKQCKVDFENDQVRVLHWTIGPGEKIPMHEHPATVTVSLTGGKTRFTLADGKTRETEFKPGQAQWTGPEKHASENLSGKTGESIQIELKAKPAAKK